MGRFSRTFVGLVLLHLAVVALILGLAMRRGMAAEVVCAPTADMIAGLRAVYGEIEIGGGQQDEQTVIRIFASPDGRTFSVLQIGTDGSACMIASGEYFEITRPRPANERES